MTDDDNQIKPCKSVNTSRYYGNRLFDIMVGVLMMIMMMMMMMTTTTTAFCS